MASVDELELLSRLQAGELDRDEAVAVRALVSARPDLQQALARLERLDGAALELGRADRAAQAADGAAVTRAVARAKGASARTWAVGTIAAAALLALSVTTFWRDLTMEPTGAPFAELERERETAADDGLPPYPPNVPGVFVGPLSEGMALWTPETRLARPDARTVALGAGTVVVTGRGTVTAAGATVEIDGEALVSTEPALALPHVIRSLHSHPEQEGVDMRERLREFRGRQLAPVGAALLVLVTAGEVWATSPDAAKVTLRQGQHWSPPAASQPEAAARTLALEGTPQKQPGAEPAPPPGPATVERGKVDLAGVHTAVLSVSGQLSRCFAEGLKQQPSLQGDLTFVLLLEPSGGRGALREATVSEDYSLENPFVASCMLQALNQAKWPAPEERTVLRYPLRFVPRGGAAPGPSVLLPEGAAPDGVRRTFIGDREERLEVIGRGHRLGPDSAKVKVVVFSDFECSFCLKGFKTLLELRGRYGDRIQVEFRHKPLPSHPHARNSAAAVIAAEKQGRFWELATRLVDHPGQRMQGGMEAHAAALGLDLLRFRADMASAETIARIDADIAEGERLGVRGTPTHFINGREIVGARPAEALARLIDEELAAAAGR